MAETEAKLGFGTLLQRGNGQIPEIFTTVAEITDVNPPELTVDTVPVTHHESPNAHREKIPGLVDTGNIPFKGNWLPTNLTQDEIVGLVADIRTRRIGNWRVVLPNAVKTWTFPGFMTKFKGNTPLDKELSFEGELAVRSAPAIA